jgi:hypothetical protein
MRLLREITVVGALLAGASAQAAPKNIDDCEKIKEPMAYNECLASFGPAVGHVGAARSYAPAGEDEPRAAGKERRASAYHAPARRGAGGIAMHGANGRVRVEFTPRAR